MATETISTINLRKTLLRRSSTHRRERAITLVREQVARMTKSNPWDVYMSSNVSNQIVSYSAKHMTKLKLKITNDNGKVSIDLANPRVPKAAPAAVAAKAEKTEEKKAKPAPVKKEQEAKKEEKPAKSEAKKAKPKPESKPEPEKT